MSVDAAELLRELDVHVASGSTEATLILRPRGGTAFEARILPLVEHIDSHMVRSRLSGRRDSPASTILFLGATATRSIVERATSGEFDLLTQTPLRLIHDGRVLEAAPPPEPIAPPPLKGRPAWVRWALARHLLLNRTPTRQPDHATALGSSQQAISQAARALGDLVVDDGHGLVAPDPGRLLEHWRGEYPGPGGQRFGWYALNPVTELADQVVRLAELLEVQTLISGDVAADHLAPWKLPTTALVYVTEPIDLSGDGFVPVALEEANVVTSIPRDPTLWRLASSVKTGDREGTALLADPAIVYWDLLMSGTQDCEEAAAHLADLLIGKRR
ncbi:type IV toxin-antitoxin system AbiEi family antitoxin [Brachybacterium alimentarium]